MARPNVGVALKSRKFQSCPTLIARLLCVFSLVLSVPVMAGPEDPEDGGQWGPVITWPHIAVSAANLPDGRILTWSGSERDTWPATEQTYSATWNPSTGTFQELFHAGHNMFCAHIAMLADGRVLVNGGRNRQASRWTSLFDYRDDEWVQIENMWNDGGRWYPTTIALSNGEVLTSMGDATNERYSESWTEQGGWQIKNGIDWNAMVLSQYRSTHNESNWWPLLHVAPNGQVFHSGPTPRMHYIDTQGNGSFQQVGPSLTGWYHKHGSTIMYDEGKLLTAGGWTSGTQELSTNRSFTINLNGATPIYQEIAPMEFRRKFHNAIVLPTGEVIVIGGNLGAKFSDNGAILITEIWNPDTGQWRRAAAASVPRNYHSVALLMTDGRVLSAGGGYCSNSVNCGGASHKDGQVFTPPYLFDSGGNLATRPTITSAPGFAASGQIISLQATAGVQKFSLIKMSSTTHGINTDVRFIDVPFNEVAPGAYNLTMHSNPNVLTPGYWMLFAVDASGVPSVAHVLQANADGLPWLAKPANQSSAIGVSVNLQILAGDGDGDVISFSQNGLPPGLNISSSSGLISGTPTLAGTYPVTVTVDDSDEGTASESFEWVIFTQGSGCQDCLDFQVVSTSSYANQDGAGTVSVLDSGVTLELRNNTWRKTNLTFEVTPDTVLEFDYDSDVRGEFQGIGLDEDESPFNAPRFFRLWGTQNISQGNLDFDGYTGQGPVHYRIPVGQYYTGSQMNLVLINDFDAGSGTDGRYSNVRIFEDTPGSGGGDLVDLLDPSPTISGSEATIEVDPNLGTLEFDWNFGDNSGNTGFISDSSVNHTYSDPGLYVVTVTVRDTVSGNEESHSIVQLIHQPLTENEPSVSSTVAVHDFQNQVWVVNPDNDTVTVIDAIADSVISEVGTGDEPSSVAVAPNNNVWVVNKKSATISVYDSASLSLVSTIPVDFASQPHGIAFSPTNGDAFVALEATGDLVRINSTTYLETGRRYVDPRPRHVSVSGNGTRVYVSRFVTKRLPEENTANPIVLAGGIHYGGEVAVINASTMNWIDTVVLRHSNRLVSEHSGPGIPNYLGPAVVSPDGTAAWVPSKQDNVLAGGDDGLRSGQGMTFDQTVRAVTSKFLLGTNSEDFSLRIDHDNASVASHAAFDKYGVYIFTTLEGNREVAVSNSFTGTEIIRFDVGRAPNGIAVLPELGKLYVHNFMDRTVGIYDISALTERNEPDIAEIVTLGTVGSESLSANVFRGKQLFYDARDDRLASDDYMSCASCHNSGGGDGRIWDFTGLGEGLRNTITLEGRAGMAHGFLHWSSNFDELQDFEGQIREFSKGDGLMDDSDFNSGTRSQPLGQTKAGFSADLDALAAYLTSLNKVPNSPFRNPNGSLGAQAEQGQSIFADKDCVSCHTPSKYTDSGAAVLHNIGTITPASGSRLGGALDGIDTPTLKGVWKTAPYLHDGSALDITEAISAHNGISLTSQELDDLAAYLQALDEITGGTTGGGGSCEDCLDFSLVSTSSYANQDGAGTVSVLEDGAALELRNNTWRKTNQTFQISADTILEFEFESSQIAEFQGIGFDNDESPFNSARFFRLRGTQNISQGILDFDGYVGPSPTQYQIPVGQYYTGSSMYLVLINDYDQGSGTDSLFRNVRLVQGATGNASPVISNPGTQSTEINTIVDLAVSATDPNVGDILLYSAAGLPTGLSISSSSGVISGTVLATGAFNVTITVSDGNGGTDSESFQWSVFDPASGCLDCVDFNIATTVSFSNQDQSANFSIADGGATLVLADNTWRRTTQTFNITPSTVLEFDYQSSQRGEFQGIGFDENENPFDGPRFFRLHGTQNVSNGITDFSNYVVPGTTHYVIPVGQYYNVALPMFLVLINDFDAGVGPDSRFSNVRIYESGN